MKPNKKVCAGWLVTAIEGGIGYWAEIHQYCHEEGFENATIQERGDEAESFGPKLKVTWETMLKGWDVLTKPGYNIDQRIIQWMAVDACSKEGEGAVDSYAADAILQAGILGEVRYG